MKVEIKVEYNVITHKECIKILDIDFSDYLKDCLENYDIINQDDLISAIDDYAYKISPNLVLPEEANDDEYEYYIINTEEIATNYSHFIEMRCKHENENGKYCSKCGLKLK